MSEHPKTSTEPVGARGLIFNEPVIFETGSPGRMACSLPACDVPEVKLEDLLPAGEIRESIDGFPELSELDVVRHFTRLSQWNVSIDTNFYPLGSCTMKYNPKINENIARLPGFARQHPYAPEEFSQGCLQLMHDLQEDLKAISGMDHVSLQPAAGAQGEFAGMLMIHAWHEFKGRQRKKVLLPDSAHGTNPASAALCGYTAVQLPSGPDGLIHLDKLSQLMDEDTAAIMLTNPNTLGMFEKEIIEICNVVHAKGGLVYCDGANLNAVMGKTRMGDMGIDVMHINLHKTFSTPHGGGGPGGGPIGVRNELEPFLPTPVIEKNGSRYRMNFDRPQSIGKLKAFWGNFGILVRAFTYIRTLGRTGIREAAEAAVLNANYIKARLKDHYHLPYPGDSLHEVIFNDKGQGVTTMDIAKTLIDYGFHPPTVYFPLIVKAALMIEPTESESKETIDQFIDAMIEIKRRAEKDPDSLHHSPIKSKVSRPDEARAARHPILRWQNKI